MAAETHARRKRAVGKRCHRSVPERTTKTTEDRIKPASSGRKLHRDPAGSAGEFRPNTHEIARPAPPLPSVTVVSSGDRIKPASSGQKLHRDPAGSAGESRPNTHEIARPAPPLPSVTVVSS